VPLALVVDAEAAKAPEAGPPYRVCSRAWPAPNEVVSQAELEPAPPGPGSREAGGVSCTHHAGRGRTMRIGLLAMRGVRAHDPEGLRRGLTPAGFVERSKVVVLVDRAPGPSGELDTSAG